MNEVLYQFLSQFDELTKEEIEALGDLMTIKEVKKNSVIVAQGQVCNECFFVLKGCLRQYVCADGTEKTIAFYTEQQAVNFFTNQGSQTASDSILCSLEDTTLLIGDPENDQEFFTKFPKLADITRKMIEKDFGKTQHSFAKFIANSPEERYLHFMKENKDLLNRVPLHLIASYLGMTPVSLSRIRKRVSMQS